MTRTKNINGVKVTFTAHEEAARDAEEVYEADPQRDVERREKADSAAMGKLEIHGLDRAQFVALLNHENRIRSLEGRQPVTTEQFKEWVKAQL